MPVLADQLAYNRIADLDAAVAGFHDGLRQIGDKLVDVLVDIAGDNAWQSQSLARQIVWIQRQLRGQLNILGYDTLSARFINNYDESELFAKQILQEVGKLSGQLVPMRADTIRNLRDMDLSAFNEFGNRITRVLSRELVLNTVAGKKRSDVIRTLSDAMDGQVEQATVYADTSIRSYDRYVNAQLWEEAGIEHFRYFGPNDNVTRQFCKDHVGKIYTLAQIKAMNNESVRYGNVLLYGGGARCRHTWTPVVEAAAGEDHTPVTDPSPEPPPRRQREPKPARSGSSPRMPSQINTLRALSAKVNT